MDELKDIFSHIRNKVTTLSEPDRVSCAEMLKSLASAIQADFNSTKTEETSTSNTTRNLFCLDEETKSCMYDQSLSSCLYRTSDKNHKDANLFVSGVHCNSNCDDTSSVMSLGGDLVECSPNLEDDLSQNTVDIDRDIAPKSSPTNIRTKRKLKNPVKLSLDHKAASYSCPQCCFHFDLKYQLDAHRNNCASFDPVSCIKCRGTFDNKSLFASHECCQPSCKLFISRKCGECPPSCGYYQKKLAFTRHRQVIHGNLIASNSCLQSLCKDASTSDHNKNSQGNWSVPSVTENENGVKHTENSSVKTLSRNAKTKFLNTLKGKWLYCDVCSLKFEKECLLKDHISRCHANQSTTCTPCQRNLYTSGRLHRHNRSNGHLLKTGISKLTKDHMCSLCNKSYFRKSALVRHMQIHTQKFKYKCVHCPFKTIDKSNLDQHVARHFDVRQFKCTLCDNKFVTKRVLEEHMLFKHSTERKFPCDICEERFKTRSSLTRHKKTHSDTKSHQCGCGSLFLNSYNLVRHMKQCHDSRPSTRKTRLAISHTPVSSHESSSVSASTSQMLLLPLVNTNSNAEKMTSSLDDVLHQELLISSDLSTPDLRQELINGTQVISLTPSIQESHTPSLQDTRSNLISFQMTSSHFPELQNHSPLISATQDSVSTSPASQHTNIVQYSSHQHHPLLPDSYAVSIIGGFNDNTNDDLVVENGPIDGKSSIDQLWRPMVDTNHHHQDSSSLAVSQNSCHPDIHDTSSHLLLPSISVGSNYQHHIYHNGHQQQPLFPTQQDELGWSNFTAVSNSFQGYSSAPCQSSSPLSPHFSSSTSYDTTMLGGSGLTASLISHSDIQLLLSANSLLTSSNGSLFVGSDPLASISSLSLPMSFVNSTHTQQTTSNQQQNFFHSLQNQQCSDFSVGYLIGTTCSDQEK